MDFSTCDVGLQSFGLSVGLYLQELSADTTCYSAAASPQVMGLLTACIAKAATPLHFGE